MAVILELAVPAENIEVGQATLTSVESHISLEQIVPTDNGVIPYLWVETDDYEAFEAAVRGHESVDELHAVTDVEGRRLYRVYWKSVGEFIHSLVESDATILEAHGSDPWTFRLMFPSRKHVTTFRELCADAGLSYDVRRVTDLSDSVSRPKYNLTDEQYEALLLAIERGYYSIPREVTLAELANEIGISQQAMSERLRRGTAKVLVHLIDDRDRLSR